MNIKGNTNEGNNVIIVTNANNIYRGTVTHILDKINTVVIDNKQLVQGKNIKMLSNKGEDNNV